MNHRDYHLPASPEGTELKVSKRELEWLMTGQVLFLQDRISKRSYLAKIPRPVIAAKDILTPRDVVVEAVRK